MRLLTGQGYKYWDTRLQHTTIWQSEADFAEKTFSKYATGENRMQYAQAEQRLLLIVFGVICITK